MSLPAGFYRAAKLLLLFVVFGFSGQTSTAATNVLFNYTNIVWKFRANSTNFSGDWKSLNFDDSSWSNGFGAFATHSNERLPPPAMARGAAIRTLLSTNDNGAYVVSYYFRSTFEFSSNAVMMLTVSNFTDDGAVFYLNGKEIRRTRMPGGTIHSTTYATSSVEVGNADDTFSFMEALQEGTNVLAVEVHQAAPFGGVNNPDAVFGLALSVYPAPQIAPAIIQEPLSITAQMGEQTELRVNATGNPPPQFQWYWNSVLISGANQPVLSFPSLNLGNAGDYFFVASNYLGSATSQVATISVIAPKYIQSNSVWKYHAEGIDLGTNWNTLDYDDTSWSSGPAILGTQEVANPNVPVINTMLPSTNSAGTRIPTQYFRKTFVSEPYPEGSLLVISNLVDDDAIFYLNGREIYRQYAYTANGFGFTTAWISQTGWRSFKVPATLLRPGTNILTARLHQYAGFENDVIFAAEVTSEQQEPTALSITNDIRGRRIAATDSMTLLFGVEGGGAIYRWFKDGVLLENEKHPYLTFSNISFEQQGSYQVIASNVLSVVTSRVAVVEVFVDSDGPEIRAALRDTEGVQISLIFDEEVTGLSLTNLANYNLFLSNTTETISISNLVVISPSNVVLRLAAPLLSGSSYLLSVSNLLDRVGNVSNPDRVFNVVERRPVFAYQVPWLFWANTNSPPGDWTSLNYDDSIWLGNDFPAMAPFSAGPTFSIIEPRTSLNIGLGHTTYYFRRNFELPANVAEQGYSMRALVEDGAVFYVNGVELQSIRMPDGGIIHSTLATHNVTNNNIEADILIPSDVLVAGENTIAVEVHIFRDTTFSSFRSLNLFFALRLDSYSTFRTDN